MGKKRIAEKGKIGGEKSESGKKVAPLKDKKKKKSSKGFEKGRIYIKSTYNNTMITVTDEKGDVITWATAGTLGFSGPKKATPFAASKVISAIVEKVAKSGPRTVDVYVSGIGPGRDSAIRSLASGGFDITSISDVTPVPFNGPRPRKSRRG